MMNQILQMQQQANRSKKRFSPIIEREDNFTLYAQKIEIKDI